MGVGDGSRIVVYDSVGLFSAPRAWWTFRVMGVNDVFVLNGGLPKWKREGRPLEDLAPAPRAARHFTSRRHAEMVRDVSDMLAIVADGSAQIVDARSPERFAGSVPEPRPGLRSGHIPGARNLPWQTLLTPEGTLKPGAELAAAFAAAGVDVNGPVVTSCGSGISACTLALALATLGNRRTAVYDGSWTEWGADPDLPIETGSGA